MAVVKPGQGGLGTACTHTHTHTHTPSFRRLMRADDIYTANPRQGPEWAGQVNGHHTRGDTVAALRSIINCATSHLHPLFVFWHSPPALPGRGRQVVPKIQGVAGARVCARSCARMFTRVPRPVVFYVKSARVCIGKRRGAQYQLIDAASQRFRYSSASKSDNTADPAV